MTTISVILSSTRQQRFGDRPAEWILRHLQRRGDVDAQLLDLRDFPMPFFDEPTPPSRLDGAAYEHEAVRRWTREIAASDGFVIVTPEYNHGYPAVLKNALDYVYAGWNRKPVAFVAYGSVEGSRAVEQLRQVVVELQMAPVRTAVHVPMEALMAYFMGGDIAGALAKSDGAADAMIDDLVWWTKALGAHRAGAHADALTDVDAAMAEGALLAVR